MIQALHTLPPAPTAPQPLAPHSAALPEASRAHRLILALAALLITVLAVSIGWQLRLSTQANLAAHATAGINDFQRFHERAAALLAGRGAYVDDGFPTPPITLLILAPLTHLSPPDAQLAWACFKPVLAAIILLCCLGILRGAQVRLSPLLLALLLAAWLWPVLDDVQEGQMNLLMLAPLAFGLWAAQRESPAYDYFAGLAIALAACIKVTPLILLPYFILRRRWRLAAACLAGLPLFLILVPAAGLGFARNAALLAEWTRIMILPYLLHANIVYASSESVPSFCTRLLSHAPTWNIGRPETSSVLYMNVLDLPLPLVGWIVRILLLAAAALGGLWMRRRLTTLRSPRYIAEIAAVTAFMLWASERTWSHHYVTLIFALGAAAAVAGLPTTQPAPRRRAVLVLAAATPLLLLASDAGWLLPSIIITYARMLDLPLWLSIFLVIQIVRANLPLHPGAPQPSPR